MASTPRDFGVRLVRTATAAAWAAAITYAVKHGWLTDELRDLLSGAGAETVLVLVLGAWYTLTSFLEDKLPAWARRILSGSAATPDGYSEPEKSAPAA